MLKPFAGVFAAVTLAVTAVAQTPAGGEFRVNSHTTGLQISARPAMEADGDFIVVWQGDLQGGSGIDVLGQRYAASGTPRGGQFRINGFTVGSQLLPHVAVGRRGSVVVWGSAQDGSASSLHGQRYDAAGAPAGSEFAVNSFTTGDQYRVHVGLAADGRFVVGWRSDLIDGDMAGIVARQFDASGAPQGPDFVVNTTTTGFQGAPHLAVATDGAFVAVWEDGDGSSFGVRGQRFDASGIRAGSELRLNTFTTQNQRIPSVSVSPAGGFVASWRSSLLDGSDYGVVARRFDTSGNAVGAEFVVNTFTASRQYGWFCDVAHDASGRFVVTWSSLGQDGSGYGIFAQRFDAAGQRRGAEFRVNTYTTGSQRRSAVTGDEVGNFVVTWESDGQDGSGFGVFAQRFGGLGPAALVVDSAGNRVWEPGETVDVRPSWRNSSGAGQVLSGTLGAMVGPPGAVYAITDGTGDYGTVPDGVAGACSDCYEVTATDPPTRAATHLDATAVESLLPDAHGQQKRWSLHVGRSFGDVTVASPFYRFVETLLHHQVTGGCAAGDYCPASASGRDQMAVFVLVAREGPGYAPPACGTPMFSDVPAASPFCRWIEELARRGVVGGCGGGAYCPMASVTREQMAVFVLRTLDPGLTPPACVTPMFSDVPAASPFCRWIEELARRGVVTGCGGGGYCPGAPVTREQMGVFIAVAFGLTLYGP